MKKPTHLKTTIVCIQTLTVAMMLVGLYIQHDWLNRQIEYANLSDSVRMKFVDKFIKASQSADEEHQISLVKDFVVVEQKADHHMLDGVGHFQQACQKLYLGVIGINILGILVLWFENRNTKAPDVNG